MLAMRRTLTSAGLFTLITLRATGQTQVPSDPARFEVVSVKVHPAGDPRSSVDAQIPNRYSAINLDLQMLIVNAYDMRLWQLESVTGPIATVRFDVIGTTNGPTTAKEKELMLQRVLADRFKLVLTRKEIEGEIYVLVTDRADGRLGPNIKRSPEECTKADDLLRSDSPDQDLIPDEIWKRCFSQIGGMATAAGWQVKGMSMNRLAGWFANLSQQTIEDRTDLRGLFDFQLRASIADLRGVGGGRPGTNDADAPPSIFTALREQLGLKLERRKGITERFVVEHVEMPSPD